MQQLNKKGSSKLNEQFVNQLKQNGVIKSESVFQVMKIIDRGDYIEYAAYQDRPQGIGYNVTISAPHMHIAALELLQDHLKNAKKTLDVGSGTGYLTVAFQKMFQTYQKDAVSYGIEHIPQLVQTSIENISKNDKDLLDQGKVKIVCGDGRQGLSEYAPYDCIHVGAAAEKIPPNLLEQLANGGRMLIPVGSQQMGQEFLVIDKDQNGKITQQSAFGVRYVPLTSAKEQCPELKK